MKKRVSAIRLYLEQLCTYLGIGMRAKLIILFVVIKVLPLVLLAFVAWRQSWFLGEELKKSTVEITSIANKALSETGSIAIADAKDALDLRAREDLERMTTDTAQNVANFLYGRDADIRFLATLKPERSVLSAFLQSQQGRLITQGKWVLSRDAKHWQPAIPAKEPRIIVSSIEGNANSFNYRPLDPFTYETRPLYLEATIVGLDGVEKLKVTTSPRMDTALKDVSQRKNTYVKAETYFDELKKLKPGEIYVSDVIGAYVGSKIIGAYTPAAAAKAGIPFEPEHSAYANKENPVGKRFQGLVRWATPLVEDGKVVGYITLALDHDHIMEFTNHITPAGSRYSEIADASEGNYAFIWDYKGRNIVHPRHFSITGYDPETGDPQVPWLEDRVYDAWQASGESYADFIEDYPTFQEQSNSRKPAKHLTKQGLVGLDCRYLNFAAQCTGWFDLTKEGGSGSFVILWSGLLKRNTAAAIPYYTGPYAASPRGFGFVTIGAGVDEFHRPAIKTQNIIDALIAKGNASLAQKARETQSAIANNLMETATSLSVSTAIMGSLVILIAIWMASAFTNNITSLIRGISRYRSGERQFRFNAVIKDEIGTLADSFDEMVTSLEQETKDPLVILNMQHRIVYANDKALALMDRKLEDAEGELYEDVSFYPTKTKYCPITALLAGVEPDVMYDKKTGKFYKGEATFLYSKDGEVIGYIVDSHDVTDIVIEQKKNEGQRVLLNTIFSASPDLMWYKDIHGKYLAVNPRFGSMVDKKPSELVGHTATELFPLEKVQMYVQRDAEVMRKKTAVYSEEVFEFGDGHIETVDSVRTPIFDSKGTLVGILGVSRDVSNRVTIETELRNTQKELNLAVVAANKASKSKSEFLARMSHEIRTPMNAIIGMTNIAKRKLEAGVMVKNELIAHIKQIEISAKHLLGLLNDILDISKIEAGKIELTNDTFDLPKFVENVAAIIRPRCVEKNIEFDVIITNFTHTIFKSDELRLRQVIINLLGNAVKFTPECGTITFTVSQVQEQDGKSLIHFAVSDTGIGISAQSQERLFIPSEQGGGEITKQYGGTGLGLSISRSIVNLFGGEISVNSIINQGSTFFFEIWMAQDDTPIQEVPLQDACAALVGKRILLVDDVDINRLIVVEQLAEAKLIIDEANDGHIAVDMFANSPEGYYNLILMDLQMPQMDGCTAAKAIRQLPREDAKSVPIIALTANVFAEDIDKAIAHGMNAHLAKPLEYDKLLTLLVRYMVKP